MFAVKLARLLDLAGSSGNVRLNDSAVARLDTPHIPTPETIIAQSSLRVHSGEFSKEMLLSKLQSQCEQLADFLLKNAGMATYVKSVGNGLTIGLWYVKSADSDQVHQYLRSRLIQ